MESSSSMRTKVFIGYCHQDARYLNELLKYLRYYERNDQIEIWIDKKIAAGSQWGEEIKQAIETTKIAVLLISPGFMASDDIAEKQLPLLLNATKKDGMIVLPVIISPFNLDDTELAKFQPMNSPSMPVVKMKRVQREELWVRLVEKIIYQRISQNSKKDLTKDTFIFKNPEKLKETMHEGAIDKLDLSEKGVVAYLRRIALSNSRSDKRKKHS